MKKWSILAFMFVALMGCNIESEADFDEFNDDGTERATYTAPYTQTKFQSFMNHSKLQYGPSPQTSINIPALKTFANSKFYLSGSYMAFYVNKASSDNGDRTELRQQLTAGDDNSNWYTSQTENSMSANLRVVQSTSNECTVLQIHEKDGSNKPLLRMAYMKSYSGKTNNIWAVVIKSDGSYDKQSFGQVDSNFFSCKISVKSNTMTITANGVTKSWSVSYWASKPSYFKAGCYPQGTGAHKSYFNTLTYVHTN